MIKPLPGYVLVEPIKDDDKSSGGIYLPESTQDKPMKGKVIKVCDFFLSDPKSVVPMNEDINRMIVKQMEKKGLSVVNDVFSMAYQDIHSGTIVIYKKWTNQEVSHEGKEYLLVKFDELLGVIE